MGTAKRRLIESVVVSACRAACTAAGDANGAAALDPAPPPPRYLGIYADDGTGLKQITYNSRLDETVVLKVQRPTFYTYGIDLNAGLLAPMDPAFTVGLEVRGSPSSHVDLEIEPIEPGRLYFRYSLRDGWQLADGDYTFYIRERFGGTKAVKAVFRVAVPATNSEE